jgi:hypothetical protein
VSRGVEGATTPSAQAVTSTVVLGTTITGPIDVAAVFTESLAASSANYRFASVVLIGEQTLTIIEGVVDGTSVAAEIVTGSSAVSYVRTPDGQWITGSDGEWVELEGEPPTAPPLTLLADAGGLTLQTGDGNNGVFAGQLGPAAGTAQGIAFSITIENGLITEIRYQVDTGGDIAQVITTFSDIGGAGLVSVPEDV